VESELRRFHAAHPGVTSRGLARGGSYERLWARVSGPRVLDLACGDRVMPGAIGVDMSREELARGGGAVVQARAQVLPFADATFDAAVCHLGLMVFDDLPRVVAELARVLAPGATFHALVGGGPTADGRDAFHAFAERLPIGRRFGDARANRETGWHELFAGWNDIAFERWPIDLAGSFDELWAFLGGSYQLDDPEPVRAAVRAEFPFDPVPCTVVTYYGRARVPRAY
jgi:SAM-dependent methyltransferase